ncbi:MAG: hypothetical protein DRH26_17210, partial [Deltaproteobacteria bacterium]
MGEKFKGLRAGHIYIVERPDSQVKIGCSITPEQRVRTIETQGGFALTNIFISEKILCYQTAENEIHKILFRDRKIGEWFVTPFEEAKKVFFANLWQTKTYLALVEHELNRDLEKER